MFVPDYTYYTETFKGDGVSESDYGRLSEAASEILSMLCGCPLTDRTECARAICCQIELMGMLGGVALLSGAPRLEVIAEKLDDASITRTGVNVRPNGILTVYGIPVSPLAVYYLRQAELTCRVVETEQ